MFGMQQGEVFNGELIRKGFENLKKIYGSQGYINFTPIPRQDIDDEAKLVNVVFDFDEGHRYRLRRLDFVGNTTTRDKVIRREVLVNEGEFFSTQLMDISLLRLNQLGFFDILKDEDAEQKPDPKASPGPDGPETYWVDVNLKVKEKGKNSIGFTGGVSGYGGSFLGLNYSTNNFMGYGETLGLHAAGRNASVRLRLQLYRALFPRPATDHRLQCFPSPLQFPGGRSIWRILWGGSSGRRIIRPRKHGIYAV